MVTLQPKSNILRTEQVEVFQARGRPSNLRMQIWISRSIGRQNSPPDPANTGSRNLRHSREASTPDAFVRIALYLHTKILTIRGIISPQSTHEYLLLLA